MGCTIVTYFLHIFISIIFSTKGECVGMKNCVIINWPPIPPLGGDNGGEPGPIDGVF